MSRTMADVIAIVVGVFRGIDIVNLVNCSRHRRTKWTSWCCIAWRYASLEDVKKVIIKVIYRAILGERR